MSSSYPQIGYKNIFADYVAAIAASSEDSDYPVERITDCRQYTKYKAASIAADVTISVDCGSAVSCDYFALASHNLYSAGLSIAIESSDDDSTWTSRATLTPTYDSEIFQSFTSASARYWRAKISDAGSATEPPSIGVLYLGQLLEFPEYLSEGHDPLNQNPKVNSADNQSAMKVGVDVRSNTRKYNLVFKYLQRSFVTGTAYQAFLQNCFHPRRNPFFFCHNESSFPDEPRFLMIQPKAKFSAPMQVGSRISQLSIPVQGVVS